MTDDRHAWLERLDDPAVVDWIARQEAVTRATLDAVPGSDRLGALAAAAARYPRRSAPFGGFEWRAEANDEKRKLCRGDVVVLDPNTWPATATLLFASPSPDGRLIAFGRSTGGSHSGTIGVFDTATRSELAEAPAGDGHLGVAWRPDGSGFFFTTEQGESEVVREYTLGGGERHIHGGERATWCTVAVQAGHAVITEWQFVHANDVVLVRLEDDARLTVADGMRSINAVQVLGDTLLIHTDRDAPRGRACTATLEAPDAWRPLIDESDDVLQTVTAAGGRIYAVWSHRAAHRVTVHALDGTHELDLPLPGLGSVNGNAGQGVVSGIHADGDDVYVDFESFTQPPSVYRVDGDTLVPHHVPEAPAAVTEQVDYASADGTSVPMFLVHAGTRGGPTRLAGYGGFGIAFEPGYHPVHAAWLALGGMLAFAGVRGGGEYGRAWHEAATGTRRRKAFEDFIAAARWLADTTGVKPVARGNSNGGLLVAASLLLDPDAFAGVFCRAALLDMLGFTRFPNSATATVEYGSPDDPEERAYLRGYSPLHNVAPRRYPPVALVSALNDRTAPPYDPLKLAAELQDRASGGPFLVLPLRDSGHGGGTTVSARIDQDADELRFLCLALDLAVVTNEPSREPPSAEATRQSQSARGSASEGGL